MGLIGVPVQVHNAVGVLVLVLVPVQVLVLVPVLVLVLAPRRVWAHQFLQ
jgi:hypothetical protein